MIINRMIFKIKIKMNNLKEIKTLKNKMNNNMMINKVKKIFKINKIINKLNNKMNLINRTNYLEVRNKLRMLIFIT